MNRLSHSWGVFALILAAGAQAQVRPQPTSPLAGLAEEFPGVKAQHIGGVVRSVYGRGMTRAASAIEASAQFLDRQARVFGAGDRPELAMSEMVDLGSGGKTVFHYEQTVDGVPVEYGKVRVLVRHLEDGSGEVVFANAKLAAVPEGGFRPDVIAAADAHKSVVADGRFAAFQEFSEPSMVIYAGQPQEEVVTEAVRAWKFVGVGVGMDGIKIQHTFFVDASSGALAGFRDEILHADERGSADVTGTLKGWGSPGLLPDIGINPPQLLDIPEQRVSITGGGNAFTNRDGTFVIQNALPGPLTVTAGVNAGRWVAVAASQGTLVSASVAGAFPPGPVNLVLNPTPSQFTTAQVNAAIHQTLAHNYFRDRAPSFTALDFVIPANVNLTSTCNAFYDPIEQTTNFYNAGGSCPNTAFSAVIAHEYGHHIVNRLGLAQGAFGEGFSDTIAMMLYDDPQVGRYFNVNTGAPVRNPETANQQYPCTAGAVHACGQILGGTVWEMRRNFASAYGAASLELIRQLHVDWALITAGGIGLNSAHPQTAIEFLTVDDVDGNINNGTPNYALICDAFAQHGVACPQLALVQISYPNGQPSITAPAGGTQMAVSVGNLAASAVEGSARIFYSVGGGPFQQASLQSLGSGQYLATFPGAPCPSDIRYYVAVDVQGGGTVTDPANAPLSFYSALAATEGETAIADTVETDLGWSLVQPGDNSTSGRWTRGNPIGTQAQPENDVTADPGVNCFFTGQGTVGGALGENDVDGGSTTLTSPPVDLTGAAAARVSYYRWYSNNTGGEPAADTFVVQITSNGTTWVPLETVGPAGAGTTGGWIRAEFNVQDFVPLGSAVRVRFIASDLAGGSLIEAAVDEFRIEAVSCVAPPACPGDANGDLVVDFGDITVVLAAWQTAGPVGDVTNDGAVNFGDITEVLNRFGTSCP
ncbi:MAG: hypothetical protein SFZ24_01775 [Planctomycetota bacterium]|nr:hypothetical protein [Planctomycetota bacterium]